MSSTVLHEKFPTPDTQKKPEKSGFFGLSSILYNRDGGGEAEENSVMACEEVNDLKHLPPMYAVGDDMLTGVYLIGKATLRMMYCGEAEE